jgi:hypothetical protein
MPIPTNNTNRWSGHIITTRVLGAMMYQPCYAEVNHTVIGEDGKGIQWLYGVANDTFGCYKWNLETCQIMTTYTIPSTRNINHFNNSYTMALNHNSKELLTGGEDGQLRIWDIATDLYVDVVNINLIVGSTTDSIDPNRGRPNASSALLQNSSSKLPQLYISACTIYKEQWWIIGGGFHHPHSSSSSSSKAVHHGYITIIHGTTRSILSFIRTPYKVQHLSFFYNSTTSSDNSTLDRKRLMVFTNTNYIYGWTDPFTITDTTATPQKIWCHTPSAYAMATTDHVPQHTNNTDNIMVVGGIGSTIDVYNDNTQLYLKLTAA